LCFNLKVDTILKQNQQGEKMVRKIVLLAGLFLSLFQGCQSPDPVYEQNNTLWRQGYGFNNPNAERIRQGLPPKDF
jgi:hypothetical protein